MQPHSLTDLENSVKIDLGLCQMGLDLILVSTVLTFELHFGYNI